MIVDVPQTMLALRILTDFRDTEAGDWRSTREVRGLEVVVKAILGDTDLRPSLERNPGSRAQRHTNCVFF